MIRAIVTGLALAVTLALPARAIDIQDVKSPGGLTAWLVEDHSIPFVALSIAFPEADGPARARLSSVSA